MAITLAEKANRLPNRAAPNLGEELLLSIIYTFLGEKCHGTCAYWGIEILLYGINL